MLAHQSSARIEALRSQWLRDKCVLIRNILTHESALAIHNYLASEMPEDKWDLANYSAKRDSSPKYNRTAGEEGFSTNPRYCYHDRAAGHFSYIFERTLSQNHDDDKLARFLDFITSPGPIGLFNLITGLSLASPGEIFASRYRPGHFLSPHHDRNNGNVAFVFNLTREWMPDWGGNLHSLKDDKKTISRVIQPHFNSMSLMHIDMDRGIEHFVSDVAEGVNENRLSVTGWLI